MLTLRYARQTRAFLYPPSAGANNAIALLLFSSSATQINPSSTSYPFFPYSSTNSIKSDGSQSEIPRDDVVCYFREWFMSRKKPLFDSIFEILRTQEGPSADLALSGLNLHLTETLILDVFNYEKKDVLSCLKFFDWAGRQPGFHHNRATFSAIFRILSTAKLMSLMLDFLENYMKQRYVHKVRYYNILVIGYAVAGKCETALELFGRMRFVRVDLDAFAYHVLLNSLVEEGYFDVVETVANEIRARGFQNEFTHSIMIKSFCKQNELEKGAEYLHNLVRDDATQVSGIAIGTYVDALCKDNQSERAALLVEEFRRIRIVSMEHAYGVWIVNLLKAGKLDGALEFLKDKQAVEGYVPDVFRYNMLICRLLRENRFEEVYDMLVDMKERGVLPDDVTMNVILCFLCKVGRLDIAMELYDSKEAFMPNDLTYDKFITALCRARRVEEGHLLYGLLNRLNKAARKRTYIDLISGFSKSSRGDIAGRLLIEMQEKGYSPSRKLVGEVISCLCKTDNPEYQFFRLLEMHLALCQSSASIIYNFFIDGAAHAEKPDLARQVYEMMRRNGIEPDLRSDVLILRSYLDNNKISQALHLFRELSMRRRKKKLWHVMIVGLCNAKKPVHASQILDNMKANRLIPSIECYEKLIKLHCDVGQYFNAIDLLNDMTQTRPISSFIGNVFLLHALRTRQLYNAWAYLSHERNLTPACWMLGHVIGVFSGSVEGYHDDEELEKLIQQCFNIDIYTNNMLLRRLSSNKGMDHACKFFDRLCEKGYEPNRWTYNIIVHGLAKYGRKADARIWMEEMHNRGFSLTEVTKKII